MSIWRDRTTCPTEVDLQNTPFQRHAVHAYDISAYVRTGSAGRPSSSARGAHLLSIQIDHATLRTCSPEAWTLIWRAVNN
jgi:hypothetical protein